MTELLEDKRWWQQPLQVTLVGVVVTAAITAAVASVANGISTNRWMERTDNRLAATETRMAELSREQQAGRDRGDDRQRQINLLDRQVAVITARLQDIIDLNQANSQKLDRLMEQRFGAN